PKTSSSGTPQAGCHPRRRSEEANRCGAAEGSEAIVARDGEMGVPVAPEIEREGRRPLRRAGGGEPVHDVDVVVRLDPAGERLREDRLRAVEPAQLVADERIGVVLGPGLDQRALAAADE